MGDNWRITAEDEYARAEEATARAERAERRIERMTPVVEAAKVATPVLANMRKPSPSALLDLILAVCAYQDQEEGIDAT